MARFKHYDYQYSRRLATAEPVFANICSARGLKRFSHRGRTKVNTQWLLYCLVHNIGKVSRYVYVSHTFIWLSGWLPDTITPWPKPASTGTRTRIGKINRNIGFHSAMPNWLLPILCA